MDRIEINGIWYVREDMSTNVEIANEVTIFEGAVWEDDMWCFEAARIKKEDGSFYDGFSIDVLNKKTEKKDYIDNMFYMDGLIEGLDESIKDAKIYLDDRGINSLISFIKYLKNEGWS
jgi:hypothetical protein